jgi:hypothetical protein
MILRNPQFLAFLMLVPLIIGGWLWRRGRLPAMALVLRVAIVTLIIVALANPVMLHGRIETAAAPLIVVLVDQSDSLTDQGKATLRARAATLAAIAAPPCRLSPLVRPLRRKAGRCAATRPTSQLHCVQPAG